MRAADERRYSDYVAARLPSLHRLAYLLCGDAHRADDIAQVAITRLYRHWGRASRADNIDGYVRSILVRAFLDEQRLRWAAVRLVGRPQDTPHAPVAEQPDVATSMVIHAALTRLPPRQRAVLVLRFLDDLSVAQTAEALGCSEGNVKRQTSDGLTRLRGLLGDKYSELGEGSAHGARRG
jgi:RNA polymerase sigma-70 factor (sigma-E family)